MTPEPARPPLQVLLVSGAAGPDTGRLGDLGMRVTAFGCGLAALGHVDGGAAFDAAVIDEAPAGLSGQALTLALRHAGFRGPLVGLAGDPAAVAGPWRRRGCDAVLPHDAAWAEDLARLLPRTAEGAAP